MPQFQPRVNNPETKVFTVPDTIEGWSDSLGVLLSTYLENPQFPEFYGAQVVFDDHLIRPEGAPLASGAGKAPGPDPLMRSLDKIRQVLEHRRASLTEGDPRFHGRLRPIDIYDIVMHASDAVLAGGVRRSATICLFSPDDEEMANAKTGTWFLDNPQRGRSNNSAVLVRSKTTRSQFQQLLERNRQWGEPGFIWSEHEDMLFNPCVEAGFWSRLKVSDIADVATRATIFAEYAGPIYRDDAGDLSLSGWQGCNLSTINGAEAHTLTEFLIACEAAAIQGVLQKGFVSFPYLGRVSEEIFKRESLLGVSITRMMSNPQLLLNPEVLQAGARRIKEVDAYLSPQVGVNPSARNTCLKPEGTSTPILDGLDSGCHHWPFRRGIRHVQGNKTHPVTRFFAQINPHAVTDSIWSANQTDYCVAFAMDAPEGALIKGQDSAIEFLEIVKGIQHNWVLPGKSPEHCTQPWLTHNVSNTVMVKPHEWDEVADYIWANRDHFCGISLIAESGDRDYRQAPFVGVYDDAERRTMYGAMRSRLAHGLRWAAEQLWSHHWDACETLLGNQAPTSLLQKIWIRASRLIFSNDIKTATYAIKDDANWQAYLDLKRLSVPVDYGQLIESDDTTKPMEEVACAGGACQL